MSQQICVVCWWGINEAADNIVGDLQLSSPHGPKIYYSPSNPSA